MKMTMKKVFTVVLLINFSITVYGSDSETKKSDTSSYQIAADDQVLITIDSILADKYYNDFVFNEAIPDSLQLSKQFELDEDQLKEHLAILDEQSPFDFRYNNYVKAFINLYINKKRKLSSSVLALAPHYFPLFEETLDRFNMPLELKYLAVVESALNPSARSRVGAQGLWQFMYHTGRMYKLKVNSYEDDRMNPYKATVAACEYMNDLYKMYGDWSLVLAAYNSGPGNVNKAIRRSGGKRTYWEIRNYLPRETRGYVPAFIAVNYMMKYAKEYELYPIAINEYSIKTDTVHLSRAYTFDQLSSYMEISKEELKFFNPMYKLDYIPKKAQGQILRLPVDRVGMFLTNEKAIIADLRKQEIKDSINGVIKKAIEPEQITHYVRRGEFLGSIANRYRCSVRDLMSWNNMRSTRLNPGDRLIIYSKNMATTQAKPAIQPKAQNKVEGKYKIHTVKNGDTLWDIANLYSNTTVSDIKRLNSGLNHRRLKPGMKLKVKQIG